LLATLGSLAVVLGLFAVVVWVMRRGMPKAMQRLPNEVVEVLGQTSIGHRQQAQLIRLGHKLLLVSVTPQGSETLTEITDAAEVERLAGLCRGSRGAAATPTFREVLQQFRGSNPPATPTKARSTFALPGKGREVSDA
jgi:flagellar biogenesis protein FliO